MRILAIDHGSRRVGVAIADTELGTAFARPALRRHGGDADVAALAKLAADEGAQHVVIGLPLNMDGSEGSQAASARRFGDRLAAAGLEVVYVDERLSSWEADRHLASEGRRPPRQSGERDSAAARVILQQYLDMTEETE